MKMWLLNQLRNQPFKESIDVPDLLFQLLRQHQLVFDSHLRNCSTKNLSRLLPKLAN
jgi:hypothetical protein